MIPSLNEAKCIARAVETAWEAGCHEVVVADGGSSDDTVRTAEASGAQVIASQRGRGSQQNAGALQTSGDVLLFLHADNRLGSNAIRQIAQAMTAAEVLGGAFSQRIEAEGLLYRLLERGNKFRAARLHLPYGDQGIFMRRHIFEQLGGFPEIGIMEDVVLMRQFQKLTTPIILPGPLYVSARRWQSRGVVSQTLRNWSLLTAHALGASPERLAKFYPLSR